VFNIVFIIFFLFVLRKIHYNFFMILYICDIITIHQCVFIFLNFNKPVKFIKASKIAYNEFISAQRKRNHSRYIFFIRNRYIFSLSMFNRFIVIYLLVLKFSLE